MSMIAFRTGGPEPSAAQVQQASQKGVMSLHVLTSACHGVRNTVLKAPPVKPDWFDGLNASLAVAQANAANWIDNLAPQITSVIPVQIVNYGSTFSAGADEILDLLSQAKVSGSSPALVQQALELTQALRGELTIVQGNIADVSAKLVTFGQLLQKDHTALFTGAGKVQDALASESTLIAKLNADIERLQTEINYENTQLMASEISVGTGLFLMAAGLGLTLATGPYGLVVLGAGFLTTVGGAIGWGIWADKIKTNHQTIADDQAKITAANQQVAALTGLSTSVNATVTWITQAQNALSDVQSTWNAFGGVLDNVIADLGKPNAQLPIVLDEMWVRAAQKQWDGLQGFAKDLMETSVTVDTKTFDLPKAA